MRIELRAKKIYDKFREKGGLKQKRKKGKRKRRKRKRKKKRGGACAKWASIYWSSSCGKRRRGGGVEKEEGKRRDHGRVFFRGAQLALGEGGGGGERKGKKHQVEGCGDEPVEHFDLGGRKGREEGIERRDQAELEDASAARGRGKKGKEGGAGERKMMGRRKHSRKNLCPPAIHMHFTPSKQGKGKEKEGEERRKNKEKKGDARIGRSTHLTLIGRGGEEKGLR